MTSRDFGVSAGKGFQNHHLIPVQLAGEDGMEAIADAIGFDFNDAEANRIRLPSSVDSLRKTGLAQITSFFGGI